MNLKVDKPGTKFTRRFTELFHDKLAENQFVLYKSFRDYGQEKPVGTAEELRSERRVTSTEEQAILR